MIARSRPGAVFGMALTLTAIGAASPQAGGALVPVNGTELFVRRIGSGEPIVVVHGGPVLEHGYLLPHLAPLAQRYELVFYDQRLSGRSAGRVETDTVRLATFVGDIEALRARLGLGRIHLMGHSWGGLLAMSYAIAHPDQLRSLVLLDSMAASSTLWRAEGASLGQRMTDEDRARQEQLRATEAFAARQPDALRQMLMLSFATQFHDRSRLADLDLYVPDDYIARSEQFGALMVDLADFDLHQALGVVDVPTLIVYGSDEPGLEIGGAQLHASLPRSRRVVIDDAGHFPFIEQPEAFNQELTRFLDDLDRGR